MPEPEKALDSSPTSPWALSAVLGVLVLGVGFVAAGHWRRGSLLIAGALLLGAALRLLLPRQLAGLLVTRRRIFDVVVMGLIGAAIVALALIVPGHSR